MIRARALPCWLAVALAWCAFVALPMQGAAQEIIVVPLDDLQDGDGFTLQDLEDDGITLETFQEGELDSRPRLSLSDEQFQTFEQDIAVTAAGAGNLRVLDKLTGVVTDLTLEAEASQTVGRVTMTMHECRYPTESPTSDAYMRLSVADIEGASLFEGWMIASSPALVALDHPRYDVWPLRCATPAGETVENGEEINDLDNALADAEEAERPQGAVTVSPRPRPRP